MSQQLERHPTDCDVVSFARGFKIWWAREGQPYFKDVYSATVFGGAFAIVLSFIVHVFFPVGVLLSTFLPSDAKVPASYIAFEHSPEVVVAITSLGAAPFVALAMFVVWVRHVCSLGKSNP